MKKLHLLLPYLLLLLCSCKTHQLLQKHDSADIEETFFEYAPWGWRMEIPDSWKSMNQDTWDELMKEGKQAIDRDSKKGNVVTNDKTVLTMEDTNFPKSSFTALSWPYLDKPSITYSQSRLERFGFYVRTLEERGDAKVDYTRGSVYLGDMLFEAIYITAKLDAVKGTTLRQAVFETIYNGEVIYIGFATVNKETYDKTINAVHRSTFTLPQSNVVVDWKSEVVPKLSFKIPPRFTRSSIWTDSTLIYKEPNNKQVIAIEPVEKEKSVSIEDPRSIDIAKFKANLEFRNEAGKYKDRDKLKLKNDFLGGKRLLRGDYIYTSDGIPTKVEYVHVGGKESDFIIRYFHEPENVDALKILEQLILSITEK